MGKWRITIGHRPDDELHEIIDNAEYWPEEDVINAKRELHLRQTDYKQSEKFRLELEKEREDLIVSKAGFPACAYTSFPLEGFTTEEYIANALETVKSLGWNIVDVYEDSLTVRTMTSFLSFGEEIIITVEDDTVYLESECAFMQVIDWGINKKRIKEFLEEFEEITGTTSTETNILKFKKALSSEIDPKTGMRLYGSEKQKDQDGTLIPNHTQWVTTVIIGINLLIFAIMVMNGANFFNPLPVTLTEWGANYKLYTLNNEYWRLLTNTFLHIGIVHLAVNMYALYFIGKYLEPLIGYARFISAYLLSGIGASFASLLFQDNVVSAGASGAIFGMYGLFLALLSTKLIDSKTKTAFLSSIGIFIAYNLFYGFTQNGIDNAAHVGGLITGALIGYAFIPGLTEEKKQMMKYLTIIYSSAAIIFITFFGVKNLENPAVEGIPLTERYNGKEEQDSQVLLDVLEQYHGIMKKMAENETAAMELYILMDSLRAENLLTFIREQGIPKWDENLNLAFDIDILEGLPDELFQKNKLIKKYMKLRKEAFGLIYKALDENTDKYYDLINNMHIEITQILKEIEDS
ncbi:MAG: rhomboid family intramembrane serine protease [Candidatus Kapaibacterium sp.]